MPKPATGVLIYDEALQLHIKKLKIWGYLQPGKYFATMINWHTNGQPAGEIQLIVNTTTAKFYIELIYHYRDEPRRYRVDIEAVPSNLGKGVQYFFICPYTGKRCRKLYSIGGYFCHRTATRTAMYACQVRSHYQRHMDRVFSRYELWDKTIEPYFKTTYAGKETKRYKQILRALERSKVLSSNFPDWL